MIYLYYVANLFKTTRFNFLDLAFYVSLVLYNCFVLDTVCLWVGLCIIFAAYMLLVVLFDYIQVRYRCLDE